MEGSDRKKEIHILDSASPSWLDLELSFVMALPMN
jgi:hypothetical protein